MLTLQLPRNSDLFPSFLNHVWAFDHTSSTEEDQNRTRMYQENAERQQYREQSLSLKDFIKGLQLRVDIADATAEQLGRVSQLTFRTNQFNFTTVRRSESEIRNFLEREDAKCLVVRVTDRFGDYGLVGVVMYEAEADRYKVDTLLLSCRVLGRGVEHALVSRLGQRAVNEGKDSWSSRIGRRKRTCRPWNSSRASATSVGTGRDVVDLSRGKIGKRGIRAGRKGALGKRCRQPSTQKDPRRARYWHSVSMTGPSAFNELGRACATSTGLQRPSRNTGSGSNLSSRGGT